MAYLLSVPDSLLREIVREEHQRDDGFSARGARLSLLLDVERGSIKSQRAYARIWGWSRGKVRNHWDDLWQDVARWVCSEGRQLDHPLVGNLPDEWVRWLHEHYGTEGADPPTAGQKRKAHSKPTKSPPESPSKAQKLGPTAPEPRSEAHDKPTDKPIKSPSEAHNYISHPLSLDDEEDDRARAGEKIWFLDGPNAIYREAIAETLAHQEGADASEVQQAVLTRPDGHLPPLALKQVHQHLVRRYGTAEAHARLVAALVITDDAARHPNLQFLRTTLNNFLESHEETAHQAGETDRRGRSRSVHQRQSQQRTARSVPRGLQNGQGSGPRRKRSGELTIEENLRESGYSESAIRSILDGGPVCDPPPEGHGQPRGLAAGRSNGRAHD